MLISLLLTGCSGNVLPSSEETMESPWQSFAEAKQSFDQIQPSATTHDELQALGFDPTRTPNVRRLNYLEIIQRFMPHPSIRKKDLDPGLRRCIAAKVACYGYEIRPEVNQKERYGNAAMDFMNFRKNTRWTGWKFAGLVVLNAETVVYKVWDGIPQSVRRENRKNPLGPLQNIGDLGGVIRIN